LILRAAASRPVSFRLSCDRVETFAGVLEPGALLTRECAGVFEVHAGDAGAVNVSVNGERLTLGRPGRPIAGRHISLANLADFSSAPPAAAGPP
jgi:hypothetical protein